MLSIILPTRNRPDALTAMIDSALTTAAEPRELEFCVYVDEDDLQTKECINTLSLNGYNVKYTTSSNRINLSQMWNYAYSHLATGDIIMLCADDIRFRTLSWDKRVRDTFDAFNDKIVLVYGDDLVQGAKLSTHPFVHRRWIEISGFWLPPYFVSDFVDLWLNDVAHALGRRIFISDVVTEHMHYSVGKSEIDETTKTRLQNHAKSNPGAIYNEKSHERSVQCSKLRQYMV